MTHGSPAWLVWLDQLLARDQPIRLDDVATFRDLVKDHDRESLDTHFSESRPDAPLSPSLLLRFPALAEAQIAVANGVEMPELPLGASANYFVYDRLGPGVNAPIGVLKRQDLDYQPEPAELAAIRSTPSKHPMIKVISEWFPDPETQAQMLRRFTDEDRFFYLGTPLTTGPIKEVIAGAVGHELGLPQTEMTDLGPYRGSFQAYVANLDRLEERPELWRPGYRLLAYLDVIQRFGIFTGVVGQEDTWEFYAVGPGPKPTVLAMDYNKCFTDLLLAYGMDQFSLMLATNRELRQTMGWLMTLPLVEQVRDWSPALEKAAPHCHDPATEIMLGEARLMARLWHACRQHELSVWDFLALRIGPLTSWFHQNGRNATADPSPLAEQRAAARRHLPKPFCGAYSATFCDVFGQDLTQAAAEGRDAINPWFLEDLGIQPLYLPEGGLDTALFPDGCIHSDTEPDGAWTEAALAGLRQLCQSCFGDARGERALVDLSHLIAADWAEALAKGHGAGHGVVFWPDGAPTTLIGDEQRGDENSFRLEAGHEALLIHIHFTRHLQTLADAEETQRCETEPRVSRFHLSLSVEQRYNGAGKAVYRVVSAEAAFGYALVESRPELFMW